MYRLTPFSPEHTVSLRKEDLTVLSPVGSWGALVELYAKHPSWSLWCDDKYIASGGVVIPWKGIGDGWMLVGSEPLEKHGKALLKYVRLGIKIVHEHLGVQRVQAVVLASQDKWVRYAAGLGLKTECLMRKYGPDGEDYLMMSRTEWDQ